MFSLIREYVFLQNEIKLISLLEFLFCNKHFSYLLIQIRFMGIHSGYFPTICLLCSSLSGKINREFFSSLVSSREAMDIVVFFYNSKYLNCIGALSFFKDLFTLFSAFFTSVRNQIRVVILVKLK